MGTNPTTGLLILKSAVSIGKQPNNTTISYETASKANIEMSFVAKRPPIPSKLFMHCPNLDSAFHKKPLILSMVDDFFLVRVIMVRPGRIVTTEDQKYDYFIYNPTLRMLDELSHLHPLVFNPNQVGLLPRGDQYTVAVLVLGRNSFMYELYLFNSEARSWKSMALRVRTHLRKFPIKIPNNSSGLLRRTSNVITIGGESGTMGWVDLWSDILFCDVLHPYPELRTVPLPLPLKQINSSEGDGIILGSPRTCRGIAYIEAEHCLKFVEIRFDLSSGDDKTGSPFETKVWSVKTSRYTDKTNLWDDWYKGFEAEANDTEKTNLWDDWDKGFKAEAEANDTEKTNLWDDWDKGFEAEAKDIIIGSELSQSISELHSHHDGAVADPTLKDLCVFQPGLSIDDKQVVYLLTSGQFGGDATWVLALDLESKTLVDVAKFGTRRQLFSPVIYCRGTLGL